MRERLPATWLDYMHPLYIIQTIYNIRYIIIIESKVFMNLIHAYLYNEENIVQQYLGFYRKCQLMQSKPNLIFSENQFGLKVQN